jgi:hypothetical protein
MSDVVSLMGFEKGYWEIFGAIGNWAAVVGSVFAAGVALRVANRGSPPVTKQSIVTRDNMLDGSELVFQIANLNDRNLRVTGIGWQLGRRPYAKQVPQRATMDDGGTLPIDLAYGQTASLVVPTNAPDLPAWTDTMLDGILVGVPPRRFNALRAVFFTSVHKPIDVYLDNALISSLKRRYEQRCKST